MNWIERRVHPPDRSGTGQTARSAVLEWLGLLRYLGPLRFMGLRAWAWGWAWAQALVRGRPVGRGLVFGLVTSDVPTQPRTHLVWSIVAAALFFLPLGLVAVVFSWRTGVWKRRDDLARARRNSRLALGFIIVTIIVGVLVYGGLLGALLALGAFSSPQ